MSLLGLVSLVGAGPGSPDYLTLKGLRRLQEADVVFHDALVTDAVLAFAEDAEYIDVGKRGHRESTAQNVIEAAMITASRQGLRVVRLKGGDPFVFGRGGEEALALAAAGIPFEVVPGVSAAIAAPALGGIPVTHRGVAPGVLVVNGSLLDDFERVIAGIAPGSITVVVMMGLRNRGAIAAALAESGWADQTPAAIVLGASTDGEWTWRGPLADLEHADIGDREQPGTIVVGAVAALRLESPRKLEVMGVAHVGA
jgi:uroporphyrin-III C-methyltransferase/precorrin-2 dehydrogenase/sirohydrochlorin ferrochelatase